MWSFGDFRKRINEELRPVIDRQLTFDELGGPRTAEVPPEDWPEGLLYRCDAIAAETDAQRAVITDAAHLFPDTGIRSRRLEEFLVDRASRAAVLLSLFAQSATRARRASSHGKQKPRGGPPVRGLSSSMPQR